VDGGDLCCQDGRLFESFVVDEQMDLGFLLFFHAAEKLRALLSPLELVPSTLLVV
jgi:hypothetical protein